MDEKSAVLAWQAKVAREIARLCEHVLVLTDKLGKFEPAPNMEVVKLPVRPFGVPRRFGGARLMNLHVARLCRQHKIDACFIHMVTRWAYMLKPCFSAMRIPVLMWYAHGTVTPELHRALEATDRVVTSTPEGFRIESEKVRIIGQGIDTDLFTIPQHNPDSNELVYVGRISRRKRILLLIDVMNEILESEPGLPIALKAVGPGMTDDDRAYDKELKAKINDYRLSDRVEITGHMPIAELPSLYRSAFLHINVSETGSMDKTVNESLACGCPVLTSNPAFGELLTGYPDFRITDDHPSAIAKQVVKLYKIRNEFDPCELRNLIVGKHDLKSYAAKIVNQLREISERG